MQTHNQLAKKLLRRPGVRSEVERIEREEGVLLDALLNARQTAASRRRSISDKNPTSPFIEEFRQRQRKMHL